MFIDYGFLMVTIVIAIILAEGLMFAFLWIFLDSKLFERFVIKTLKRSFEISVVAEEDDELMKKADEFYDRLGE